MMLIVRLAKIAMTTALAAFAFIVTYDNLIDYGSNYEFVKHVLSMDTTFPGNKLMDRAITDPRIWTLAYAAIIAAEGLTFLLLLAATIAMLLALRAPTAGFQRAKVWLAAGGSSVSWWWAANFLRCGNPRPGTGRRRPSASI